MLTLHTKPEKSARLMPKILFDFSAQCAIDQELGRALERDCLSDILGEMESNPARFCRTGLSRGRLHLTSTTGHTNGSIPEMTPRAKLLRVKPGGERRAISANKQAVSFRDREQPRTDWQLQGGTRSRRHLASDSCTRSCGEAGSPHTIKLPSSMGSKMKLTCSSSWSDIITKFCSGLHVWQAPCLGTRTSRSRIQEWIRNQLTRPKRHKPLVAILRTRERSVLCQHG